jgi:putative sigma-54 modulation protein
MEIHIQSFNGDVSNNFKKVIKKKFQSAARIYKRAVCCDVALLKENNDKYNDYCIEAKIVVPGNVLFAKESAENFESALDKLITDVKHQLLKYKEKLEEVR